MKKGKNILLLLLASFMLLALAACGGADTPAATSDAGNSTSAPAAESSNAPAPTSGSSDTSSAPANDSSNSPTSADGSDAQIATDSITDPDEVKAIVAQVQANSNWDDMVFEAGILDTISEIINLDREYTFRIGNSQGGRSDVVFVMEMFKSYIEASTAGKVTVETYPLSQLGTHAQGLEGVLGGSITGWVCPIEQLYNYAPGVGVASIPLFFDQGTYQAVRIFTEDPTMDDYLKSKGFWPVNWGPINSSNIISSVKLDTVSDFSGAKIWVQPTEMMQMLMTSLGATPVLFDSSEIALSFQTGVIDAACSGISFFDGFRIQESAKYMYRFPMAASAYILAFSVEYMESLPENLRNLIIKAGKEITGYHYIFNTGLLVESQNSVAEYCELVIPSEEFINEAKNLSSNIADFYTSQSDENARLYEVFKGLIEADHAAGGEGGIW